MADIELVIKIPENVYKNIQSLDWKNIGRWSSEELKAIHNGTPLPKGHGRLIDADELKQVYENTEDSQICKWSTYGVISEIDKASTVIEAEGSDKE